MSERHSTAPSSAGKPQKPSPDFPLFAHATGRWAKKLGGKMMYFGPWDDPAGALRRYKDYAETGKLAKMPARSRPRKRRRDATHAEAPAKPYPDFPLYAHATGRWAKNIRGKLHYFGPWEDPDGALAKYLDQKDALHAGRKPRNDPGAVTVKDLVNAFLNAKHALVNSGELSSLTWGDYKTACDEIVAAFGKHRLLEDVGPDDFADLRNKLARKWGPQRLSKTIQFVRCAFKYAYEAGLLDRPVRFGLEFKRPSKKVLRLHRARQGVKLFTAEEVRTLLAAANTQVRAMILLGINCGYGNSDCGNLPQTALDLVRGWANYPRPKTGIPRRSPLWPETVAAIQEAMAHRPEPKREEHGRLVFLTRCGDSWHTGATDGPLSREMSKLLRRLGITGRKGIGFYTLRHTFRTVADEAKDQPAADYIKGHEVPHMSSVYRETISDARLKAVSDHVRAWLFPPKKGTPKPEEEAAARGGEKE
jgi:integrase